jgi:hypothetical protein
MVLMPHFLSKKDDQSFVGSELNGEFIVHVGTASWTAILAVSAVLVVAGIIVAGIVLILS